MCDDGLEQWAAINGFPAFEVSTLGRVRAYRQSFRIVAYRGGRPPQVIPSFNEPEIVHQCRTKKGYKTVCLVSGEVVKRSLVHRLVAAAFIPNPTGKPCVNHIDACKENNSVKNLEWCTIQENSDHAKRLGLLIGKSKPRGVFKDEASIHEVRDRYASGESVARLASDFGVTKMSIYKVLRGQIRRSLGLKNLVGSVNVNSAGLVKSQFAA